MKLGVVKNGLASAVKLAVRNQVLAAVVGLTAISAVWGNAAYADPSEDALTQLNELSRQAEQLTESMRAAQADLDGKLAVLRQADEKHAADLAALNAAQADLAARQGPVDKFVAAVYVSRRTDALTAMMTAPSPKNLIDTLSVQRVLTTEMANQVETVRRVSEQAQALEAESVRSAAAARDAVDAAAAVRANLQNKQSELKSRIAEAAQRAVLTAPPETVMAALGRAPIPTVGMAGLVPNARRVVQYIMATYPGVRSIGGVRADPLPDHPSGRAVDIMIGSDMGLGDAINADILSRSAEFGVSYTMWRVASHFDHIHITVF